MAALRKDGLKMSMSTPRRQSASLRLRQALRASSVCITAEVTSIRLAVRVHARMNIHMGSASPRHVYDLMYSGI